MSGRIRLHINIPFNPSASLRLTPSQSHYLLHVMRLREGDPVHVFNGHQGEWRTSFVHDKRDPTLVLDAQTSPQTPLASTGLIFSPIKPKRLEFLVEKATELNVGALHPAFMKHTSMSKVNRDKLQQYAIEAAEQCERLTVPVLHKPKKLPVLLSDWEQGHRILWAAERGSNMLLSEAMLGLEPNAPVTFLVGPEGGFTLAESNMLEAAEFVTPVSLGQTILRVETAALVCLALALQLRPRD